MLNISLTDGPFKRNPKIVKYIIIHCSATPRGRNVSVDDIRAWHRSRGFKDVGYHFVVGLDGSIQVGRPLGQYGAHCLGKNSCSIGVCYVGGVEADCKTPADTRTDLQKESLKVLIDKLLELFPDAKVCGHRDFAPKACPSFDATAEYAGRRSPQAPSKRILGAGTGIAVALTSLSLSGCRAKKNIRLEETVAADVERRSRQNIQTAAMSETRDSCDTYLENPLIIITDAHDSTVTFIKADGITRTRRMRQNKQVLTFRQSADTLTVSTAATVHEQTAVTPADSSGAIVTVAVVAFSAILLSAFLRKKIFKS